MGSGLGEGASVRPLIRKQAVLCARQRGNRGGGGPWRGGAGARRQWYHGATWGQGWSGARLAKVSIKRG